MGAVVHGRVERIVQWGDLDALGIVFYPRYYEWIDAAAHAFFDQLGLNLNTLWHDRHIQFGLVHSGCRYRQPGRYQQQIRIITKLTEVADKTLTLGHRIEDGSDGHLMVEGREERICIDVSDAQRFRAISIPPDIRKTLTAAIPG